jgi:hypothetical protein
MKNKNLDIPKSGVERMPTPTEEDLKDPEFNAIWDVIKSWDVNVSKYYKGYSKTTGSHVMLILNALRKLKKI